jgi:hypothetical protein
MSSDVEMMLEVLDTIQDAPESVEIIVGMINHLDPDQPERAEPVDERAVRAAVESLLTRDFVVVDALPSERSEYVQVRSLEDFGASQLWVRPTEIGTAWLHENAPPHWYSQ